MRAMAESRQDGERAGLCKVSADMSKRPFRRRPFSLHRLAGVGPVRLECLAPAARIRSRPMPRDKTPNRSGRRPAAPRSVRSILRKRSHDHEAICYFTSKTSAVDAVKGLGVFGFSSLEKADPAVRAAAFERAALAVARLDATLNGHPLLPAWQHWVRLEAVRVHAGLDGHRVDPQRFAAYIEGLRLRVPDTPAPHERGCRFLLRFFTEISQHQTALIA